MGPKAYRAIPIVRPRGSPPGVTAHASDKLAATTELSPGCYSIYLAVGADVGGGAFRARPTLWVA